MSDWDALFDQASNLQSTTNYRRSGPSSKTSTKKRSATNDDFQDRKKKKKYKRQQNNDDNDEAYKKLLMSRTDPVPETWPVWMSLQDSFICKASHCQHWESKKNDFSRCDRCRESALSHRLEIKEKTLAKEQTWPLLAFCCTRNIRCCAKIWISSSSKTIELWKLIVLSIRKEVKILHSVISIFCTQLAGGEAILLESKANQVVRKADLMRTKQSNNHLSSIFDEPIRLIMACDALYYRIYYLQLTRMIPTSLSLNKGSIPHPHLYFGMNHLTQTFTSRTSEFEYLRYHSEAKKRKGECDEPILSMIHHIRWEESKLFFYNTGWTSNSNTHQLVKESLVETMESHETPAPPLLMEWRDSCRDFMCNLYAYATFSSETLDQFYNLFSQLNLRNGVVEIGAGTGYIANLFRDGGIRVDAYDIQPTSIEKSKNINVNEYHGHTPSFCIVDKASTFPLNNAQDCALLLCYPPPDSLMAYNTLRAYLRAGGKYLIHIGEFKGLTGDKRFEQSLVKNMICQARLPCLGWGTDASHLTIWVKMKSGATLKSNKLKKLLLPCSSCNSQEGIKRCRLLRSLVYCSNECCNDHLDARQKLLQRYMIDLGDANILEFENLNHFDDLI
jgi:hypothetical protein